MYKRPECTSSADPKNDSSCVFPVPILVVGSLGGFGVVQAFQGECVAHRGERVRGP